jgi:membrane fusion protein, multidrug efflux system
MSLPSDDTTGASHEAETFDPAGHRPTGRALRRTAVAALAVLGALVVAGVVPRVRHGVAMAEEARVAAAQVPAVRVARAERVTGGSSLVLPGSVQPLQETTLYARANGYVRRWRVDIGAHVKKGDVMAELDLPDIDHELLQAVAAAAQAKAGIAQAETQLELARTTSRRYSVLGKSGVTSQQEVDQYNASFDVQQANVNAMRAAYDSAMANVHRLEDLKSFGTITAPFDGVVTMRTAEVGQLVVSGAGMGQALFKVAEVDVVRVFVNVPQLYAGGVAPGMDAPTSVREIPSRVFAGKVARTSNELDVNSRTLLAEVDIPNPDGTLIAGMYAQVSFDVKRQDRLLYVPATAVLFDAHGTRAAVLQGGVVHWRDVDVAADLGDKLAIARGLEEGETVVLTPSDRLTDGMPLRPQEGAGEGPTAAASTKSEPPRP